MSVPPIRLDDILFLARCTETYRSKGYAPAAVLSVYCRRYADKGADFAKLFEVDANGWTIRESWCPIEALPAEWRESLLALPSVRVWGQVLVAGATMSERRDISHIWL
jgi:hypothetical protein